MSAKLQFFKRVMIAWVCTVPFTVFGQTEISNETELRAITNDLSGNYKLVSDITLTGDWMPIGDEGNRFTGTIDGNGKAIYGLTFEDLSRNGAGFIGTAEGAVIKNLRIVGARIYGGQDVGAVVGRAYAPTEIQGCFSSGVFRGYDHVGGIVGGSKKSESGSQYSMIENCYSTGAIVSTSWQAGGIIGTSVDIDIRNTYFAGVAVCTSGRTGGIVALADGGNTEVSNSVAMALLLKGDEANRIMGSENNNAVTFNNNYSSENTLVYVKGELYEDGVSDRNGKDGEHVDEATLKSADFYTNDLSWDQSVWKIEDGNYPVFTDQAYPIDADAIYLELFPERAIPSTTHETKAFSALGRMVSMSSSDPSIATIDASGVVSFIANGNTTLTFTTQGDAYAKGVTLTYELEVKGISYAIQTEEDLRAMKYDLEGTFTLMNNITLTADWEPIGTFKGKLNGNGNIIYGLKVDDKATGKRGLFSETEGAEITKLGIEQAYIVGNADVGAIVGNMKGGLIDQCYVADSYIAGRDHIGSLVGAMRSFKENDGTGEVKRYATVRNSYAGASVYSREYQAGGIAGIICGGTFENCYFSGKVQALKGRIGGLISLVDSDDPGEIKNCVNLTAAGYCTEGTYRICDWGSRGPESGKYVVTFANNWSKEASYFGSDLENSAVKSVFQKDDNRDGCNLDNDNNALSQSFYTTTLGWDFTTVWKFAPGADGKMYPILSWQSPPLVSIVYGIPEPAHLTWYSGSEEAIDLNKIITTGGQVLDFDVTEGAQFVDRVGNLLYVTENELSEGGWCKVMLSMDDALTGVVDMKTTFFDVEIILLDEYYSINSAEDFLAINDKLFAKFRLTQNIDMTGVDFEGIGSITVPFTGELDGNGFSIVNPVVKTNGENMKGLFNATNGAKISKLGVVNFSFSGSSRDKGNDLGGLAGSCKNTTITQCYVTGNVVGNDHVGGFIGGDCDQVTITDSYADVTITAGSQAGGFFGVSAGSVTVRNCYFAGKVNVVKRGWGGGIIGLIDRQGAISISNTVSIGDIVSVDVAGSHIGGNIEDGSVPRGTISVFLGNVFNMDAEVSPSGSGWSVSEEIPGSIEFEQLKSAADMKKQATFAAIDWDFNEVWTIEEDVTYPKLKNVEQPTNLPQVSGATGHQYIVYALDHSIYVSGIETEASIAVYNVSGQLLSQKVAADGIAIPVAGKGLYLLTITENGVTTPAKVICR